MNTNVTITISGPPGCGKSILGHFLKEKLAVVNIDSIVSETEEGTVLTLAEYDTLQLFKLFRHEIGAS